jgi:hypothetical protein
MLQAFQAIKAIIPEFNERVVDLDRILSIIEQLKTEYHEMKMKRDGYHVWDEGQDYIFIKKTLTGLKKHEATAHEGIHAMISVPIEALHSKQQCEANVLSVIALIPLPFLKDRWWLEENPSEYAFQLWKERQRILFFYGV